MKSVGLGTGRKVRPGSERHMYVHIYTYTYTYVYLYTYLYTYTNNTIQGNTVWQSSLPRTTLKQKQTKKNVRGVTSQPLKGIRVMTE